MNLINKRLLAQKIQSFEFPTGENRSSSQKLIENWQKALKDSDLEKTKEKSVQGKFLSTFFEEILGYTDITDGQDEWTLIQHPRIENDSLEPDGSLGWFTKNQKLTRAVIELKDAKTPLDKKQISRVGKYTPIEQAYVYSTKYEGCNWIVVSNFKEIRLYNKQKTQEYYEKFDVLSLNDENEFKRFYFLLSKENLISKDQESVVDILAKNTTVEEQNITKKFYVEFKKIRMDLLDHLITYNPQIEKTILLEKTQKLLDRLIFTLVCEDTSNLLPLNIVKNTYERAINSLSPSDERVWTEFKGLFLAIDKGNTRVKPPINAYNGGLFAFDTILDGLEIKDDIWQELIKLADYDFETDLNVNLLGHIFEQSISDLESIKESILLTKEDGGYLLTEDGNRIEIGKKEKVVEKIGKRKKDGIFYTPEYITRYIVENTVGKYLEEHPDELDTIKILDPACGSGAFLNQAHSFLFREHRNRYEAKINEKIEKGERITLFDYNPAEEDKKILLNNLYGVDLNQESVDITKLALWLKTARRTEPLQSLDKNIKCGNSIIDDSNVVQEKAFNWNDKFKEIIKENGFDIVIGNPPYINGKNGTFTELEKKYYHENYQTAQYQLDTYVLFIEKALQLLKPNGYLGFIIPTTWMSKKTMSLLRESLLKNTEIQSLTIMSDKAFEDASVETVILCLRKIKSNKNLIDVGYFENSIYKLKNSVNPQIFLETKDNLINIKMSDDNYNLIKKIEKGSKRLDQIFNVISGVKEYQKGKGIPKQTNVEKEERKFNSIKKIDDTYLPEIRGKNITKYFIDWQNEYISYGNWLAEPRNPEFFTGKRILLRKIPAKKTLVGVVTEDHYVVDQSVYIASLIKSSTNIYHYLGLINSNLLGWYYKYKYNEFDNLFPQIKVGQFSSLPIKDDNEKISALTEDLQNLVKKFNDEIKKVFNLIKDEYEVELSHSKIVTGGWNEILESFESKKIHLSNEKKEDLYIWFKSKQKQLQEMDNDINILNNNINEEVYKLYDLNGDEIKIIENYN